MIHTELTRLAMQIACEAHAGQTDRAGFPYIYHPLHVAQQMKDEETTVIALLHDVIEDSDLTAELLVKRGIPKQLVTSVELLSREKSMPYSDYIDHIIRSGDLRAMKVKSADLMHNLDESRMLSGQLPKHLSDRYLEAKARIDEALSAAH